ncbi:hypothetical protein LshimejAT787_1500370 [Lyophyllum shimeji]|uniref:Uncharacterized protein n=1 Tax=Lyophyllum shimeji TaxID=47721 RepID=A0A9P3USQ4_LYOSH|nr:hypothetical protein LshimejAT787_1500370 [Lyophyllum shimeji]
MVLGSRVCNGSSAVPDAPHALIPVHLGLSLTSLKRVRLVAIRGHSRSGNSIPACSNCKQLELSRVEQEMGTSQTFAQWISIGIKV